MIQEWKVFVGQIFVTNRSESAFEELPSWIPDGCMQSVLLLQVRDLVSYLKNKYYFI